MNPGKHRGLCKQHQGEKPNTLPHSSADYTNTFPALSHNPESGDLCTITFVKFWTHKNFPNLGKDKFLNAVRMDS